MISFGEINVDLQSRHFQYPPPLRRFANLARHAPGRAALGSAAVPAALISTSREAAFHTSSPSSVAPFARFSITPSMAFTSSGRLAGFTGAKLMITFESL